MKTYKLSEIITKYIGPWYSFKRIKYEIELLPTRIKGFLIKIKDRFK